MPPWLADLFSGLGGALVGSVSAVLLQNRLETRERARNDLLLLRQQIAVVAQRVEDAIDRLNADEERNHR